MKNGEVEEEEVEEEEHGEEEEEARFPPESWRWRQR